MLIRYLATHVRPDILVAVSFLTTRVLSPTEQDTKKLIRLLRYLNHTRDMGLILGGDAEGNFRLSAYVDGSFGMRCTLMRSQFSQAEDCFEIVV